MKYSKLALIVASVMAGFSSAFHFWRSLDTEILISNLAARGDVVNELYHFEMLNEAASGLWYLVLGGLVVSAIRLNPSH